MAIQIKKNFELNAPVEQVWKFITDPYQVVHCLPGAAITEKVDEQTYSGTMTVKVGPITVNYKGKVKFERIDHEVYEAELIGRAQDVKGKGSADGRMISCLHSSEKGGTRIAMTSNVNLIGPLAQFGGRMLQDVADQILQQTTQLMQQKLTDGDLPIGSKQEPVPKPFKAIPFVFKILWRKIMSVVRRVFRIAASS